MPAQQSSVPVASSYSASKAVDGRRTTHRKDNTCTRSKKEANPWWIVDLGIPLTITGVIFTNAAEAGIRNYWLLCEYVSTCK